MILIIIMLKTILQNCKNQRIDDETMKNFWSFNCLKSLIKQKACFKNPERSSCIDFILTSKPRCFQSKCVIENTSIWFSQNDCSCFKNEFLQTTTRRYRVFKKFKNRFMDSLHLAFNSQNIDCTKNIHLFFNICHNKVNHHAPRKKGQPWE